MTIEQEFFLYLLELYAAKKNRKSSEVLKEWDDLELTELICDMYERYHSEAVENSFEDIDNLVMERRINLRRVKEG